MSVIKITVDEQNLHITDSPKIAAQGVNENYVLFTFSPDWDGFAKVALFYADEDPETVYQSLVDANGSAVIPWEVTNDERKMCIGVSGVKDNVVKTSEILKYKVVKGLYVVESSPPSPGIYEQMLTLAENIESEIIELTENTPYLYHEENGDFELPVHTINDSEISLTSTWSSSKLPDVLKWKGIGNTNYIGSEVIVTVPETAKEIYILVDIVYEPGNIRSIPFLIPTPVFPEFDEAQLIVNYYGATNDGYCAIRLYQNKTIRLFRAYSGTTDLSSSTHWRAYYR